MPDVYPISWCGHSAADPCLPVQTAEVGTAAALSPPTQAGDILLTADDPCLPVQTAEVGTAAALSPPTQAGDILLTATDPCLPVQTAEGLLAAQIEADNEITVEYEGMPMLVKVQHVYSVDAHSNISSGRRIRDPSQWKSNKRKHQRNSGLEYTTRSGKTVKARAMKPGCNSKCRYKCHDKFPGTDRQAIFEQF